MPRNFQLRENKHDDAELFIYSQSMLDWSSHHLSILKCNVLNGFTLDSLCPGWRRLTYRSTSQAVYDVLSYFFCCTACWSPDLVQYLYTLQLFCLHLHLCALNASFGHALFCSFFFSLSLSLFFCRIGLFTSITPGNPSPGLAKAALTYAGIIAQGYR